MAQPPPPPEKSAVIDPFAETGPVGTQAALDAVSDKINADPVTSEIAPPAPETPAAEPGSDIDDADIGSVLGGVVVEPAKPAEPVTAASLPPKEPASDDFTMIKLGPHARPETTKAFDEVKARASAQIESLRNELADTRSKLEEFSDPAKRITPEIQQELQELRQLRDRIAVRGDPAFESKYSAPIGKLDEGIFAALKEAGATDENMELIRKLGFDHVNVNALVESVQDAGKQRKLQSMFRRRDDAVAGRDEAAREAEKNAAEYTKQRAEEVKAEETRKVESAIARFNDYIRADTAFKPAEAPVGAKPEQLAVIQRANRFLREVNDSTTSLLREGSPESIAKIAKAGATGFIFRARWQAATLLANRLKAENDTLRSRLAAYSNGSSTDTGPRKVLGAPTPPGSEPLPFNAPVDSAFRRFEEQQRNSGVS